LDFVFQIFRFSLSAMSQRKGILLVVSGPSGSGKTTLCRRLSDEGEADYSVSCTTRSARPGEVDGRDYHFLSRESFLIKRDAGEFLESAEVHGNLYGTQKSEVTGRLSQGADVVILPGGFAHGDYLRTGAIARFSPIMASAPPSAPWPRSPGRVNALARRLADWSGRCEPAACRPGH
jgi:hypothetical protein